MKRLESEVEDVKCEAVLRVAEAERAALDTREEAAARVDTLGAVRNG